MKTYGLFQYGYESDELLHLFPNEEAANQAMNTLKEYTLANFHVKEMDIVESIRDIYPDLKKVTYYSYDGERLGEHFISNLTAFAKEDIDFLNGNIRAKDQYHIANGVDHKQWEKYKEYLEEIRRLTLEMKEMITSLKSIHDFKENRLIICRPTAWAEEEIKKDWNETLEKANNLYSKGMDWKAINDAIKKL